MTRVWMHKDTADLFEARVFDDFNRYVVLFTSYPRFLKAIRDFYDERYEDLGPL